MGRQQGDVTFEAGGDTYTLRLSMNAICDIEEETGRSFAEISEDLNDPQKMSFRLARIILWGALQEHHDKTDIRGAGEIMGAIGVKDIWTVLGQALNAAFPQDDDGEEAGEGKESGN